MSLKVRWLTNGDMEVYTVRNSAEGTFDMFPAIEEIPVEIRHYAEHINAPTFCEPDLAKIFGVQSIFYPDWPKMCGHPEHTGESCIAEACKYGWHDRAWEKCPYFSS